MFDFEADNWPDDMRVTYKMIKWLVADCCYQYCQNAYRHKLEAGRAWISDDHEILWAWEQEEARYNLPIEELMFEVVIVVFAAGRTVKEFEDERFENIHRILEKSDFPTILDQLPEAERKDFEYDLKLIKSRVSMSLPHFHEYFK